MQDQTLGGSTQKEGDTKEGLALLGCATCLRPTQLLTLQLSSGSHASVLLFSSQALLSRVRTGMHATSPAATSLP